MSKEIKIGVLVTREYLLDSGLELICEGFARGKYKNLIYGIGEARYQVKEIDYKDNRYIVVKKYKAPKQQYKSGTKIHRRKNDKKIQFE